MERHAGHVHCLLERAAAASLDVRERIIALAQLACLDERNGRLGDDAVLVEISSLVVAGAFCFMGHSLAGWALKRPRVFAVSARCACTSKCLVSRLIHRACSYCLGVIQSLDLNIDSWLIN